MSESSEHQKTSDTKPDIESLPPEDILHLIVDEYAQLKTIGEELASDIGRNILMILHDNALTASEVAQKFGLSRQLVAYHLERLEKTGLIHVKEIDLSEKGKEMKRYHASKMGLLIIFPNFLVNKEQAVIHLKKIAARNLVRRILMSVGAFGAIFGSLSGSMQLLYREPPRRAETIDVISSIQSQVIIIAIAAGIVAAVLVWSYLKRRR